jgi:hypothetical protein
MQTFKASNGYVFKLYERGDICKVVTKCFVPVGTVVQVLSFKSDFSRDLIVLNTVTGKKCVVNCGDLELVSELQGEPTHDDIITKDNSEPSGHRES